MGVEAEAEILHISSSESPSSVDEALLDQNPSHIPTAPLARIEIVLQALAPSIRPEYVDVQSKTVERVIDQVEDTGNSSLRYRVEFRDGRHDIISFDDLIGLDGGVDALNRYQYDSNSDSSPRPAKRKRVFSQVDEENGGRSKISKIPKIPQAR
ncbi:unnamed protein product [Parascedosporium putredinis]|uniref:DUF7141 domain-containing protein n=1 Tax=Parascedosporium putredinis TaxID=1442378 RepID=A0A9P1MB53_9PEZI|nr:unnamed protein product [Parascedosporium putredinis]CAI7995587.1 unnamed protein product [Parascedosporium putredinis]